MIEFTVLGEPLGKARPRVTQRGTYTPAKTRAREKLIRAQYIQNGFLPAAKDVPLMLSIEALMQIPKSASGKRKLAMAAGETHPLKRPDCDNIVKLVADALNGVAYHDDSQIVEIRCVKRWAYTPMTIIRILEVAP